LYNLLEWYSRLSPWYRVALLSLYFGIGLGSFAGAATGKVGMALAGFLVGLIIGPLHYYDAHRKRTDRSCGCEPAIDDYPQDLERVERRHAGRSMILVPVLLLTGIAASWIALGTGLYGALVAFLAAPVALWALGRFGGPSDPKWKSVRDEWRRQHIRAR